MDLKRREIFGYSLGGLGKNIAYMMVSSYTLYYYNSVLNISASFVAVLLMIARVFDAFNDPFMGVIVSKTNSRFGRYKPWILSGALLNSLVMVAMFMVPENLSPGGVKFYITITYLLCGITYTLTDIPYWSVIPAITKADKQREQISLFTRTMSGIGAGIATAFTMFFVAKLGGGYDAISYKKGFSILAVIVAVVYSVLTIITFFSLPKEKYPDDSCISLKEVFITLFHNDQAMILSFIIIAFYSATNITLNQALYIFEYDLCRPDLYTPFMIIVGVGEFFAMLVLYPLLRKKITNRGVFIVGIFLGLAGYLFHFTFVFIENLNFIMISAAGLLLSMAIGLAYVLITVFIANAVDYGQKKTGIRQNSIVSSLQTLMTKLATSIAVFLTGLGIDWINYSQEIKQAKDILVRERLCYSIPSFLLLIISLILISRRKDI